MPGAPSVRSLLRLAASLFLMPILPPRLDAQPETQSFHRDWTFNYLPAALPDLAVTRPSFDDSTWTAVALPHTWQTYETTGEAHPFIRTASEREDPYWWRGWGVYRKRFIVPSSHPAAEALTFVEFEGVQKYCRVFLNGLELGEHKGGYFAFSFDLSPHLVHGGENVLVVLVSNRRDDPFGGIPPMTAGNFNVYGGIYRGVRMVRKDRLHIPFQGAPDAEGGVFITTTQVSRAEAVVRIRTWIRNEHRDPRPARLVTRITDPAGALVEEIATDLVAAPGITRMVDQTSGRVPSPRLWSPAAPDLYRVESRLESGGATVDRAVNPLGFRWFHWDTATRRLVLNGEPIVINGTNRQQEYPWLGDAMPDWLHARDLDDIRWNLSHNFIRTSHYPQSGFCYDLNDRLGLITVAEVPNIKSIRFGRDIQEAHARAMVRRLRNHPSIFFWSVGNETAQAADSRWIKEEDETRIIHQRRAEQFGDFVTHDHTQLDMENLLRCTVRGWHDQDFADPARLHPASGQVTGTEEWQHRQARIPGSSIRGVLNEQAVVWLYADHGCDRVYENAPLKYLNPKGWVDAYRMPKYIYHAWRANWHGQPVVFIQPHAWRRDFLGQRRSIQVDANAEEVELFAGADSLGTRTLSRDRFQTASFEDVLVVDAPLRAEARRAGRIVARTEVPMAGPPVRLALEAIHDGLVADRASIAVLRVEALDADGHPVGGVRPQLVWKVHGPARLLTPSVYSSDAEKNGASDGVWYTALPISTLIRSTATPGAIRVEVASPGLTPAAIDLTCRPDHRTGGMLLEPPLDDRGRKPVERLEGFVDRVAFVADLAPMRDYPHFGRLPRDGYRREVDHLIRARNPGLEPREPAYGALLDQLAARLVACEGALTEDDYNYTATLYSNCSHLYRIIATLGQHPRYLEAWRVHLARTLIVEGTPLPLPEIEALLRTIPSDGALAEVRLGPWPARLEHDRPGHVMITHAPDLAAALAIVYPRFAQADPAAQAALRVEVERLNPWLARPAPAHDAWMPVLGNWRVHTPPKAAERSHP